MLDGVTPFPAEFAARYRALGYWEDRPLFDGFRAALAAHADRVAVIDEAGPVTYRQLSERSERLARVLLELGLRPLDRVVVQLPNTAVFAYLYFALLRIGAPPVLALPGHRRREISQFASISGAAALAVPAAARGFDFAAMAADVMTDRPDLRLCLVQGFSGIPNDPRFVRLEDLLSRSPGTGPEALDEIRIDPSDPALFLLSGGTVVLGTSTRPRDVFELIQRYRVTHIHLVPALLIRWIDDPLLGEYDLSAPPSTTPGRSHRTGSTGPVTCCASCRPGTTWSRGGSRT